MVEVDRVQQHLLALGFHKEDVTAYTKRLERWIVNSGVEWVVQRLKALKLYHLQQLEDPSKLTVPSGWAVYQTRTRKVFKDPLVRMVMDLPNSGVSLLKKEGFIRVYQVFVNSDITESQSTKFYSAVTSPYTGSVESLDRAKEITLSGLDKLLDECLVSPITVSQTTFTPLRLWSPSAKRAPRLKWSPNKPGKPWSLGTTSRINVEAHNFVDVMSHDFRLQSLWRTHAKEVSRSFVGDGEYISICSSQLIDIPCGKIAFIQEGGCKLRSVANPFLAIQALGEPLKRKLEVLEKGISPIGTFDQTECHNSIRQWLLRGKQVASYDLCSFTDRYPFELQRVVLQRLCERGYISQFDVDVFETVVQKDWLLPDNLSRVKWSVGQPLGFGPSFHLATLAHASLLRGLGCEQYCVVGDDIAIGDHRYSNQYEELLLSLGVEISLSKSIVSNQFAEFCGKIISPDGVNPSTKVKLVKGVDQLVRLIEYYGPTAFRFLSLSEQEWALKVMLPEDLGGLGMQLPGQSYSEWISALRTDAIAEHRLNVALQETLGASYEEMPRLIDWLSSFDDNNRLTIVSTCDLLGTSRKGLTGISASNLFTHGRVGGTLEANNVLRKKTLFDILDEETRLARYAKLPEWLKLRYFDRFGYITKPPKPFDYRLEEVINWSTKNDAKRHQSYIRFIHRKGLRKEGEPKA